MNIESVAERCTWQIADSAKPGRTISLNGWDFGGQGPLALLHHANGMCAATWALVAPALSKHYRVFAFDVRGHGDSEQLSLPDDFTWGHFVSDLIALAEALREEHGQSFIDHGIGSSFGGIVTAAAEAKRPGLFKRITMLDPPIHPSPEILRRLGRPVENISLGRAGLVAQTLRRKDIWPDRATAYHAWRDKPLFATWQEEALQLYVDQGMRDTATAQVQLKCSPKVEAHIFAIVGSLGLFDYAPCVQVPVKLVHAKQGFFPEDLFRDVAAVFPQGVLLQLDGGHMLPLEIPDQVVKLLLDGE